MDVIVLIMASGGENKTWQHDEYPINVLLPIDGAPLVVRTIWQVRELSEHEPVVLSHWPEVQEVVPLHFSPQRHFGFVETFLSAHVIWSYADRVIVLYGDTMYHPDVLKFILEDRGALRIYGDSLGQVHAWAFTKGGAAEKVIAAANEGGKRLSPSQIHFFRRLCGCPQLRGSEYFLQVEPAETYTRDFDIARDYDPQEIADLMMED